MIAKVRGVFRESLIGSSLSIWLSKPDRHGSRRKDSQRICLGDFAQHDRTGFHGSLLGFTVHCDQSEFGRVAKNPLEVVQQGPMNVTLNNDPVGDTALQSRQSTLDVLDTPAVVLGGDSVLGNDDGNPGVFRSKANS